MAYLLSNICTTNYWNRTTIVKIIVGGWVVSFFEAQCVYLSHMYRFSLPLQLQTFIFAVVIRGQPYSRASVG